jgi:hypothetical protein
MWCFCKLIKSITVKVVESKRMSEVRREGELHLVYNQDYTTG